MGRYVIFTGKGKNIASTQCLVEGKKYEIEFETLYREYKTVRLRGIPGEFDASLFDDADEGIVLNTKVMKPACFAQAILYRNDINSYIGCIMRLKKLNEKNKFKEISTSRVEKIEHIYGNIYKIETMNTVYITDVKKRTVG